MTAATANGPSQRRDGRAWQPTDFFRMHDDQADQAAPKRKKLTTEQTRAALRAALGSKKLGIKPDPAELARILGD